MTIRTMKEAEAFVPYAAEPGFSYLSGTQATTPEEPWLRQTASAKQWRTTVSAAAAKALDGAARRCGFAIVITQGGKGISHAHGEAVDLRIRGLSPAMQKRLVRELVLARFAVYPEGWEPYPIMHARLGRRPPHLHVMVPAVMGYDAVGPEVGWGPSLRVRGRARTMGQLLLDDDDAIQSERWTDTAAGANAMPRPLAFAFRAVRDNAAARDATRVAGKAIRYAVAARLAAAAAGVSPFIGLPLALGTMMLGATPVEDLILDSYWPAR